MYTFFVVPLLGVLAMLLPNGAARVVARHADDALTWTRWNEMKHKQSVTRGPKNEILSSVQSTNTLPELEATGLVWDFSDVEDQARPRDALATLLGPKTQKDKRVAWIGSSRSASCSNICSQCRQYMNMRYASLCTSECGSRERHYSACLLVAEMVESGVLN